MVFPRALLVVVWDLWVASATVLISRTTHGVSCPTVTLDRGTFIGTTANGTNMFLGIPFAHPPSVLDFGSALRSLWLTLQSDRVGDLRFRLPEPLGPYAGKYNATAFGLSCPQQTSTAPPRTGLKLNVIVPANVTPGSKLPIVVAVSKTGRQLCTVNFSFPFTLSMSWELKDIRSYDGTVVVNRSITLQQPVIYVSMNYRVSEMDPLLAFGFLASKEVKDARVGNLGLWDQRLALHWVQKYIHAFGGDPSKVTIWGQSAGSISVSLQMVTNGGNPEGLFRAAFMQSGSPLPTTDITA
ncbi:Alpha/Beta hydrolase protein, partial [Lactarius quietus]